MSYVLPLSSNKYSTTVVSIGELQYIIITKWNALSKQWFIDIYDIDETPLILGIALNVGIDNVIKGNGIKEFDDIKIAVGTISGTNQTETSLSNEAFAIWYGKGEESPIKIEAEL